LRLCLAILPLTLWVSSSLAQRPEDAVLAVYRQMEKAEQTGNGAAWIELWSPKSTMRSKDAPELIKNARPQPTIRYQAIKVLIQADEAGLIGRSGDQYLTMRFVRESGAWKILDEAFSQTAIDPASIYALIPPQTGSFIRAGSPWENVPRAAGNARYFKPEQLHWKLQAVYDESYLYVRIEAASVLPALNTEVKGTFPNLKSGVPHDWPVMKIMLGDGTPREYLLNASDGVGDQAAFDEKGKANSHRYFVFYSFSVRKGENTVFDAGSGFRPDPLIAISDRFIDLRLPLKTLGVDAAAKKIEIRDANTPVSMILPYEVKAFSR
jgi:hypothetical protein